MYFLYSQRLRTSVSFVISNFGLTFALRYASARFKLRLVFSRFGCKSSFIEL